MFLYQIITGTIETVDLPTTLNVMSDLGVLPVVALAASVVVAALLYKRFRH